MQMTKKLEKLLAKYRKANRARLTAYARRSRILMGKLVEDENECNADLRWKRVHKVPITEELKAKLDADIEAARLRKLEVSAELRAYCKKKKYHIQWDSSNQVRKVLTHMEWRLRRWPQKKSMLKLFGVMEDLNLIKKRYYYF